jgi:hypothetical protein
LRLRSNVQQWTCNGGANQSWRYDAATGLVRSLARPALLPRQLGGYDNGADVVLWHCTGSANQRFSLDAASGRLTLRTYPVQAVDGCGTTPGSDIRTYRDWGGSNQRWRLVP